jgi:uncharacterized protein (TIGR03086 family)
MDVDLLQRALKTTREVVAHTKPEQLDDSTPCDDWNVRDLLDHLIGMTATFAAGAAGEKPDAPEGKDWVGDDHVASFERAANDAVAAFGRPGVMDETFTYPWGETPAAAALGLTISDVAVHGWDLAKATGQAPEMDDDVAQAVYGTTTSMMQPLGNFPRGNTFADPVEVPEDAPIAEKAVAYLGRTP